MTPLPSVTVFGDDLQALRQLTCDILDGDHARIPVLVAECAALFGCTPAEPVDADLDEADVVRLVQRRFAEDLDLACGAVQEGLIAADETRRTG